MTVQTDFQQGKTYCIEWKIPGEAQDPPVVRHLEFRGSDLISIAGVTEVICLFLDYKPMGVWFIAEANIRSSHEVAPRTVHPQG